MKKLIYEPFPWKEARSYRESTKEILRLLTTLTPREEWIIMKHIFEGVMLKEIAKELKITPARAGQILKRSFIRLRMLKKSKKLKEVSRFISLFI